MTRIHDAFEKEREFTSNASHELITPIGILQTKMENFIMDSDLKEAEQQKVLGMMKTLNRLKKIVHSLLLISRIENDQYIKNDTVQMREMMKEVLAELEHRMEEKEIRAKMNISKTAILCDVNHDLIFQLFYNLVNNAIRYNRTKGSVMITDEYIDDSTYVVHISDTGIGISAQEIGSIFDRFKKAERADGEGFGLGLSIVKSIAVYHGITLNVHSEIDKGTTVSVSFA